MKVLILNNHFNAGGIVTYILNLSRGLGEIGVDVTVASSGGNMEGLLKAEHVKIPLNTKSEISPKLYFSYRKLKPFLKSIDIIHANTRITRRLAAYMSVKTGLPYVSTIHGYHKPKLKNRIFPYWGSRIIAVSGFVKQHLAADFKIKSEDVNVVYNGIDLNSFRNFSGDKEKMKLDLALSGSFLITAIARLSDVKGFQYLLRAFKTFTQKYQDAVLLIAGEGREKERIKQLINSFNLNSKVKLLGLLKDIRPLLDAADIFIHSSIVEGLGISIIEALAVKKPVVATFAGGIPEIIKNNYNGVLVKPRNSSALAEALLKIREDSGFKEFLVKNTASGIEKFDYKLMAGKTYQVYKKVLEK